MFSRTTRVLQHIPSCRGALSRKVHERLVTTEASATKQPQPRAPLRTAYLKTWRPPMNVAEMFSIVREVEKKFGKVTEVHFLKDYEDTTRYQMISYLIFADPQSLERIPEAGIEMTVPGNPVNKPHYEIGIDDMESVMFDNETEPPHSPTEATSENPVVGFRLMPSPRDYLGDRFVRDVIYQGAPYRTMEHFQSWGGFAKLDPLNPPRTIIERDLWADPIGIDQNRMRAALQLCARNFRSISPTRAASRDALTADSRPSQAVNSESPTAPESPITSATPKSEDAATETSSEQAETKPESLDSVSEGVSEKAETVIGKETSRASSKSKTSTEAPATPVAASSSITPQTPSTQAKLSKKEKPAGPKLNIPPPVQKSSAPARRKDPKPKIKSAKEAKPKYTSASQAKPPPQPESKSQPEPPQPKGTLAKIWGLFSRS